MEGAKMGQLRSQKASEALTAMVARHTIEAVSQLLIRFFICSTIATEQLCTVVWLHSSFGWRGCIQFFVGVSDSLRVGGFEQGHNVNMWLHAVFSMCVCCLSSLLSGLFAWHISHIMLWSTKYKPHVYNCFRCFAFFFSANSLLCLNNERCFPISLPEAHAKEWLPVLLQGNPNSTR